MNNKTTKKIIEETASGYDAVAEQFSATRRYFWRDLEFIKNYTHPNDRILDFGCGNGRLLEIIGEKNITYIGADVSAELIERAKAKYAGDQRKFQNISGSESLPFPDDFFNTVYVVAVFHHLPGRAERERVARELWRVTKPGGRVIISVWNLYQKKYRKYILKETLKKLFGLSLLDWRDCLIPFSDNHGHTFLRFHHAFRKRELEKLLLAAGFKTEFSAIVNKKSLVFVGQKEYNN